MSSRGEGGVDNANARGLGLVTTGPEGIKFTCVFSSMAKRKQGQRKPLHFRFSVKVFFIRTFLGFEFFFYTIM